MQPPLPLALLDRSDQLACLSQGRAVVGSGGDALSVASAMLTEVMAQVDFGEEGDPVVPAADLAVYMQPGIDSLEQAGVVSTLRDEFGELRLAVNLERVSWQNHVEIERVGSLLAIKCMTETDNKIAGLLALLDRGWSLCDEFIPEVTIGSHRRVHRSILTRPRSCLAALISIEQIVVDKGAGKILLTQCDGYYQCLARLGQCPETPT